MTMHSETMTAIRALNASEIDAVCGGATSESARNDSPPPSMSETASNSGPGTGLAGCLRSSTTETTSRSGYCTAHEM
jgi:hypothetical protein